MSWTEPSDGAIALTLDLRGHGDGERARARVARAARGAGLHCGPLAIARSGEPRLRYGDLVCAVEGRLTNRRALAERLGCPAVSDDAAVAAAAYRRLGEDGIAELRGQFVLVIWDDAAGRGVLARDQLGGRSVFLHTDGGRLTAASDLPALLSILNRRPDVDDRSVLTWLMRGAAPPEATLFAGVRRLGPGSLIRLRADGWEERRYWRLRYAPPPDISRGAAADRLRGALVDKLSADTAGVDRIGVLLSGGLDSSLVAATARAARPETEMVGYSMTFPDLPSLDESALIREIAGHLTMGRVEMRVGGGSMLGGGLTFLERWAVPTPAPNTVFLAELQARAARDGIRLMLDGEGGDELFGAAVQLPATLVRRGRPIAAWRACRRIPGVGPQPSPRLLADVFRELALQGALPHDLQRIRRSLRRPGDMFPAWLSPASARALAAVEDPWAWKLRGGPMWWAHLAHSLSSAREEMEVFNVLRMLGAGSGLTRRHPLLDLDLVETVLRLPPEYAFDPQLDRALARTVAQDLLPASVALRPTKSLFTPLLRRSLFGPDLPVLRDLLLTPAAEVGRYVEPEALRAAVETAAAADRPTPFSLFAWRLVMVEAWLRSQADAEFVPSLLRSGRLAATNASFLESPPAAPFSALNESAISLR